MYMRREVQEKPRTSQMASFPAPKAGLIANRNYAQPNENQTQFGAFVLTNFFPTAQGAIMRRGSQLYSTLGSATPASSSGSASGSGSGSGGEDAVTVDLIDVESLFSYKNGNQEELFGANEGTIYDITNVVSAQNILLGTDEGDTLVTQDGDTLGIDSTAGLDVISGLSGGDWVVVQFAASGGIFLVMVNGLDPMLIYDGTFFYPVEDTDVYTLAYDGGTSAFSIGQTVTGGTSGATATITNISGDEVSGTLIIDDLSGNFQDNETLSGGSGGDALANGAESLAFSGVTAGTGSPTISTRDFAYVWPYKNRLYFVEKETFTVWYLGADAITGEAADFPMGAEFNHGGSALFGSAWSLESGDGLSDKWIVVSTEGEIVVYSGLFPEDSEWTKVGTYRTGKPMGKQAHVRAGGDVLIATDIGLVPVSSSIKRDYGALAPNAVSFPIEDRWNEAVERRSSVEWKMEIWPSEQMLTVALPTIGDEAPTWFVANIRTGAWGIFTGWDATCMEVFQSQLYFGSTDGRVVLANVTGSDEGDTYTASFVPLFDDLKTPASLKVPKLARAVVRSGVPVKPKMSVQADFSETLPSPPAASPVIATSVWGQAVWGESVWGEERSPTTFQQWQSVGGRGYALAASMQITSGSVAPLDVEIVRTDLVFSAGSIVS